MVEREPSCEGVQTRPRGERVCIIHPVATTHRASRKYRFLEARRSLVEDDDTCVYSLALPTLNFRHWTASRYKRCFLVASFSCVVTHSLYTWRIVCIKKFITKKSNTSARGREVFTLIPITSGNTSKTTAEFMII